MRRCAIGWLLATSAVTFGYQAASQDTASMEGLVVSQSAGSPLKNAIVRLRQMPAASGQSVDRQFVQQTDEEGRFLFANVPGGDWELSADKRGFIPGKYGARKYDPQGSRISLRPGEQVKDLLLKLVPFAVIAGRVLDNDGEPVEGARVAVLKVGYAGNARRWSEAASAVTLDNGEYRIPRVAPGRYLVRCGVAEIHSSGIETTYAAAYYPNAAEPALATAIDVGDDGAEINGIDVRVAPVRVFHVQGRFLPPSGGQSVAVVFLLERSEPSKVFAESHARPPGYLFDFPRVPPGSYIAWAYSMEGADDFRASQPVEVKAQDVDIILNAAAVSGFFVSFAVGVSNVPEGCYVASVQYGGIDVPDSGIEYSAGAALEIAIGSDGARVDGRTLDKDGNPWDAAVVALIPAHGTNAVRSVKSGLRGAFEIAGVPPGEYKLLALDDARQDDLDNPDFVKRFESQATAVKLDVGGTATASIPVIAHETVR